VLPFRKKASIPDAELLEQFQNTRELDVLVELFGRYTAMVYGVCLKYLKEREEAKDMVMQIFEKLVQVLPGQSVITFKSWLYVTARNQCLMALRTKRGREAQEIDPAFVENTLVLHLDDEPEMELNLSKLEKCVEQLAADQKSCVRLFFLEEHSYAQVAEKTGFNLNQVKSYIQNGKRNLKICMEGNAG
jgi:RNA polymerase sigma-70 factor (ECF subfamily)